MIMGKKNSYCKKCKEGFTNMDLLILNIVSGDCPFCATPLSGMPRKRRKK